MREDVALGYIYAIKDPRLTQKGEKDIVYVGNSFQPWEAVARHLRDSSNWDLYDWARQLFEDFPEGVEILGREVCERWHGGDVVIPPVAEGRVRLEWVILDEEVNTTVDRILQKSTELTHSSLVIPRAHKKGDWIRRLRAEGHPLLNRSSGRPRSFDKSTESRKSESE